MVSGEPPLPHTWKLSAIFSLHPWLAQAAISREVTPSGAPNMAMRMVYVESTVVSYYVARRTRDLIAALNNERGYQTPVICTPAELMEV